jgi:hypothetical protein
MALRRAGPLAVLLLATACGRDLGMFVEKFTTADERAFPRVYLQLLADGGIDSAFALLDAEYRSDTARAEMREIGVLLGGARLDSMRLIGWHVNARGDERDVDLSYEMPTADRARWIMSHVATRRAGSRVSVIGFSAAPIPGPLETLNRFTLSGKSVVHYAFLMLAFLVPVVTLTVAVVAARARGMPRRWLWTFLALIATPTFLINWTTGEVGVRSSFFLLFGGSATSAGPAAPWIISFGLPLGALAAYFKVRRWREGPGAGPRAA